MRKENERSSFPFQSHSVQNINCGQGLWTMDWHNSHCVLIIAQRKLMRNQNVDGSGTSTEIHFLFIYLSYYACKLRSNRPNWLTYVVPKSNLLRIKRFVLGISIPFKCEFYIILQIHYTKNLNPGRFELCTTLS